MLAPTFKDAVSLLSSLVTTMERAEGEYFTSKTEITTVEEKTEIVIEVRKIREEEVWHIPEIPPPQTTTERDDDWFVQLAVIPREMPHVPPGTGKIPSAAFSKQLWLSCALFCACLLHKGSVYYHLC